MKYLLLAFLFSNIANCFAKAPIPNFIEMTTAQAICAGFQITERVADSLYLQIPIVKNQIEEYPATVQIQYIQQGEIAFTGSVDINEDARQKSFVRLQYNKDISDVSIAVFYSKEYKGKLRPSTDIYIIKSLNQFLKDEEFGCVK